MHTGLWEQDHKQLCIWEESNLGVLVTSAGSPGGQLKQTSKPDNRCVTNTQTNDVMKSVYRAYLYLASLLPIWVHSFNHGQQLIEGLYPECSLASQSTSTQSGLASETTQNGSLGMRLSHRLNRTWHHWSWEMECARRPGDQKCQNLAAWWVAEDGSEGVRGWGQV